MNSYTKNSIIIKQICEKVEPGKKMLQKLMYLISRRNIDLDLNYSIHYYGPYSAKLDRMLHVLESNDNLYIDTTGSTHIIRLGCNKIEGVLGTVEQDSVDFVLNNFLEKTALELEATTTIDYVANEILKDNGSDEEVIEKVKNIKGNKFSLEYLNEHLMELKSLGYIR